MFLHFRTKTPARLKCATMESWPHGLRLRHHMAPTLRITSWARCLTFSGPRPAWSSCVLVSPVSIPTRLRDRSSQQDVKVPSCMLSMEILEAVCFTVFGGFSPLCVRTRIGTMANASFVELVFSIRERMLGVVFLACCTGPPPPPLTPPTTTCNI